MLMALVGLGAVSGVQARANGDLKRSNDALSTANARVVQANLQLEEANESVTRANDELKAANVREHERFDLAMEAIKLFHGDISKELLLKQKQFETLRAKMLRGAADFYGKLEGLLKDRQDKESRLALGRAYEELGRLTFSIGDSPRALDVFRKAVNVRRLLSEEPDADDAIKLDLAHTISSNGELLEGIGNRSAAMAAYERALAMVKRLKPADAMTEPVYRVEGRITQNIGWLYHLMGQEETSVVWLRKACEILEEGIASRSGGTGSHSDRDSRRSCSGPPSTRLSGPLGALRRSSESLADQYRALEIQRKLALETPEDPMVLYHVALTQFDIGGSLRDLGRISEALSAYREGLDILERLISESPAIIEFRRLQARCLNGCGDSARELGHASEALTYFREALGAWKRVADANPARYADGLEVGISRNRIGWLLFGTGQAEEAIKEYEAAQAVYQKLVDRFPPQDVHRTRSELANVMINLAEIQRRQKRLAEARGLCDQAIAILEILGKEFPAIVDYRANGRVSAAIGPDQAGRGRYSGAAADWRRALLVNQDLPPRTGEEAMFEAGCHAMLSSVAGVSGSGVSATDRPSEVGKAMVILRRILAEDYHAPELRTESCLEPLRGRPDFQLLMLDVDFPASPFAGIN